MPNVRYPTAGGTGTITAAQVARIGKAVTRPQPAVTDLAAAIATYPNPTAPDSSIVQLTADPLGKAAVNDGTGWIYAGASAAPTGQDPVQLSQAQIDGAKAAADPVAAMAALGVAEGQSVYNTDASRVTDSGSSMGLVTVGLDQVERALLAPAADPVTGYPLDPDDAHYKFADTATRDAAAPVGTTYRVNDTAYINPDGPWAHWDGTQWLEEPLSAPGVVRFVNALSPAAEFDVAVGERVIGKTDGGDVTLNAPTVRADGSALQTGDSWHGGQAGTNAANKVDINAPIPVLTLNGTQVTDAFIQRLGAEPMFVFDGTAPQWVVQDTVGAAGASGPAATDQFMPTIGAIPVGVAGALAQRAAYPTFAIAAGVDEGLYFIGSTGSIEKITT